MLQPVLCCLRLAIVLALLIAIIPFTYSAVLGCSVRIHLSWDDGDSITAPKSNKFLCSRSANDGFKIYGGDTDLWGHSWTPDEINNHFKMIMNASEDAYSSQYDAVSVKVFYTIPAPNMTFIDPTPANNSIVSTTVFLNSSSTEPLTSCFVNHNATGTFINETFTLENATICSGFIHPTVNSTQFLYRIFGDTGDAQNSTELRIATVNSNSPSILQEFPINNSVNATTYRLLTFNLSDPDNDLMDVLLYGSNTTGDEVFETLLFDDRLLLNGTYTYNWAAPVIDRTDPNLVAYYKLDNRSEFGEDNSNVFDWATGERNGTIAASADLEFNFSGRIGRSYYQPDSDHASADEGIKIGTDLDFNDTCTTPTGCTISAWAMHLDNQWECIVSKLDTSPATRHFSLENNVYPRFFISDDGSSTLCTALATTQMTDGVWYHLAAVYNTTHALIYVNGQLENSTDCALSIDWSQDLDTHIGSCFIASPPMGLTWGGGIDEVTIWNRSFNAEEVADLSRLDTGLYFWNGSVASGNISVSSNLSQFNVSEPVVSCIIDCSATDLITDNRDCDADDLIFQNSGFVEVQAAFTNWDKIVASQCLIAIKQPNLWFSD